MNAVQPTHGQVVHPQAPPPWWDAPDPPPGWTGSWPPGPWPGWGDGPPPWGVTPEVHPRPPHHWPRPPWWTGPWPPQPPNPPWGAPPWVRPPWAWCAPADWRTTEEAWWWWGFPMRARQQFVANPWNWIGAGLRPGVPDPWWGWVRLGWVVPQGWVPSMCQGCRAGWPFDQNMRHIGPIPLPSANRWDCNQVKWLGRGGAPFN